MKVLSLSTGGDLDQRWNSRLSLTFSREPNVAEETLALGVARTQIAGLVCAAGVLGEKLPDKTSISSGLFAV